MTDCCRAETRGSDLVFFENLSKALTELEARSTDKLLMDMSVSTKKAVLDRIVAQAQRISKLAGG